MITRRPYRRYTVTNVFLVACCVVYGVTVFQSGNIASPLDGQSTFAFGGENLGLRMIFSAANVSIYGEWWRILTAALVHLSPVHLGFNTLLIFLIGREVERHFGAIVMLSLIVASAAGGALACMYFQPEVPVGGASTVGYGLFAMLIALSRVEHRDLRGPIALLLVNLGYSMLLSNVSVWGHIGGLVGGAVIAFATTSTEAGSGGGEGASIRKKTIAATAATVILAFTIWTGLGWHY